MFLGIVGIIPGNILPEIIPTFLGINGNIIPGNKNSLFPGAFLEYSQNIPRMCLRIVLVRNNFKIFPRNIPIVPGNNYSLQRQQKLGIISQEHSQEYSQEYSQECSRNKNSTLEYVFPLLFLGIIVPYQDSPKNIFVPRNNSGIIPGIPRTFAHQCISNCSYVVLVLRQEFV